VGGASARFGTVGKYEWSIIDSLCYAEHAAGIAWRIVEKKRDFIAVDVMIGVTI